MKVVDIFFNQNVSQWASNISFFLVVAAFLGWIVVVVDKKKRRERFTSDGDLEEGIIESHQGSVDCCTETRRRIIAAIKKDTMVQYKPGNSIEVTLAERISSRYENQSKVEQRTRLIYGATIIIFWACIYALFNGIHMLSHKLNC